MSAFLTKIAHNPRVSLGPRDTKLLQETISAERRLVDATQRLSAERDRSSHALKDWGQAEGPDLGDVLGKVCTLYDWLSKAEVAYTEHNTKARLQFKDIRTKEEQLSSLKKTRDSLAGRIEAQERKVSKMKEEHKDLPTARQRLHEMQQEMIGLENNVLTDETRLGDFKRSATREALSLKLGALLELAEKTVIVGEIGKLIVDMLPIDATEPGQPRAYYDGYQRTEELVSEAQRCLQDVVFNPAPISQPFGQAEYGAGEGTHDEGQQHYREGAMEHPNGEGYPEHQYATQHYQDGSYGQQHTPYSVASPHSFAPPQAYASPAQAQYADDSHRRNSKRLSQTLPEQPLPHSGPQLQPLPDFRPLAITTPEEQPRQLHDVGTTPQVDGYASRSPPVSGAGAAGLAPPTTAGYDPHRSSLAYMGEAPPSDQGHHEQLEAMEAAQALENEAREREEHERMQYEHEQAQAQQQQEFSYRTQDYGGGADEADEREVVERDMHGQEGGLAAPRSGGNPLSPIVEVATPAMTHVEESPRPSEASARPYEYQPLREPVREQPPPQQPATEGQRGPSIDYVRPASAADRRQQYGEEHAPTTTPPLPESNTYPSHGTSYPAAETGPSDVASPTSPTAGSTVSTALRPPSYVTTGPSFEPVPRSMTPTSERRPIHIRPVGEAALGSKYGDVFVANRGDSSPLASPRAAFRAEGSGPSGYFGASTTSVNSGAGSEGGKRTVPAGAFRRAAPPGARFAPSGYGEQPPSRLERSGPSESELIAQQYRSSAIPLSADPALQAQQRMELQMAGEGELPAPTTPSFDTRPLNVSKPPNGAGVTRSGTLPSHLNPSHSRGPSYDNSAASPPPAAYDQQQPMSPGSQEGFSSNRFVTRLD
ncbi:hypothetical protein JCM10207_003072 [Rhodosporidiobolus poonsookiae]